MTSMEGIMGLTKGTGTFAEDNLVYAGGGHTVLEFPDEESAVSFGRVFSRRVHEYFPDADLFIRTVPYNDQLKPGENLEELTKALERKKSVRRASFHQGSFGIEKIQTDTLKPDRQGTAEQKAVRIEIVGHEREFSRALLPDGYTVSYKFENLDVGRYKVRSKYNTTTYDLTLRYATEDRAKDSDGYKISDDGDIEVSDKSENSKGILLSREVLSAPNMDIGLLPRSTFGFSMKKYITRIDLTNAGEFNTKLYNNESTVNLSILNPNRFNAKVYYGISLTNNSSIAGIIDLVEEDIPDGMIFDKSLEENKNWYAISDKILRTDALKDIIIKPGETKYLQIVLYVPERNDAGTFINTASIVEMRPYDPQLSSDYNYSNDNDYVIGDALSFAGVNWHVINNVNGNLTLLADSGTIDQKQAHNSTPYRWSESSINYYINNDWLTMNNVNAPILIDDAMCDDASGLPGGSFGGIPNSMNSSGCVSGAYTLSKIRLLSREEFEMVKARNLSDYSWLYGEKDYWLTNSIDSELAHNEYGVNTNADVTNLAGYVNHTTGLVNSKTSTSNLEVRPVIEIATYNIIPE